MSLNLEPIRARLRAADLALAASRGGSSDLASLRRAVGCLLVAFYELLALWQVQERPPEAGSVSRPRRSRR